MEKHRKALLYRLTYLESACFDMLMAIAEARHDFRALIEQECSPEAEKPTSSPNKMPRKPAEIKVSGESPAASSAE